MDRYQKLLTEKAKKKRELMGKMFFPRTPILLLEFFDSEKLEEYSDLLDGLNSIALATLVVLPKNNQTKLPTGRYLHYVEHENKNAAYDAADFIVVLDGDIASAIKKGCVPISQLDGAHTLDYNPLQEKGNGFYFKNPTKWEVFAAVVRALETYQFPYDWENLMREILKSKR